MQDVVGKRTVVRRVSTYVHPNSEKSVLRLFFGHIFVRPQLLPNFNYSYRFPSQVSRIILYVRTQGGLFHVVA
jgi:hypothetical protein